MSETTVPDTASKKLKTAVDTVLKTEAGRVLWAHLFHACGYNRSSLRVSRTTGELAPLSTEAAEAQRLIYIDLRRLASRELLAPAEELAETPVVLPPKEERKK